MSASGTSVSLPTTASAAKAKPKKQSEILKTNVSTFGIGFVATIPNKTINDMLCEILVKFPLCDIATKEKLILHQHCGDGPGWSGSS